MIDKLYKQKSKIFSSFKGRDLALLNHVLNYLSDFNLIVELNNDLYEKYKNSSIMDITIKSIDENEERLRHELCIKKRSYLSSNKMIKYRESGYEVLPKANLNGNFFSGTSHIYPAQIFSENSHNKVNFFVINLHFPQRHPSLEDKISEFNKLDLFEKKIY